MTVCRKSCLLYVKRLCFKKLLFGIFLFICYNVYLNIWNREYLYEDKDDAFSDMEAVSLIALDHNIFVYVLHEDFLNSLVEGNLIYRNWSHHVPILLGIDSRLLNTVDFQEFLRSLESALFETLTFFHMFPSLETKVGEKSPVGIIIKRNTILHFVILYSVEEVWRFGNIKNDKNFYRKIDFLNASTFNLHLWIQEGVLDKFEASLMKINGVFMNFMYPKNTKKFIKDLKQSRFLECNLTQVELFRKKYKSDNSNQAKRFRHYSRKLLSKTKVILDSLSIPFWLSSGTCLGFLRECDIIPYSQDLDIGVFIQDFNYKIITSFHTQNIYLKHWFGELSDSLELSFIEHKSGLKLDIFFFYCEGNTLWNGGTQVKTGKKFKYVFPKFDLCWTLFLGLKLRVPCDTETYITANYGPNWTVPIRQWDWKSSPPNVKSNGFWPRNKWQKVIKTF